MKPTTFAPFVLLLVTGCLDTPLAPEGNFDAGSDVGELEHPPESAIFDLAGTCVTVSAVDGDGATRWLADDGASFAFGGETAEAASRFFLKASDLGTYLFYDDGGGYLVAEDGPLLRQTQLQSDVYLVDDTYISGAEWFVEFSETTSFRHQLRSRRTNQFLGTSGLVDGAGEAAALLLEPAEGCRPHPEMSLDATGAVERTMWDDGDLYGFVDSHSHILSNFGFGGGGVFHGAAFHRLGVEHAMGSCELFHAEEGKADLLGWGFAEEGGEIDEAGMVNMLLYGRLTEKAHATDGWPTFSEWPSYTSATHQTQYYRWLERAWMSGLRLMVQHAVSNESFCALMADTGFQPARWGCQDMLNVDRQIEEVRNMERYIDAQSGGPGEGWFRVVESPAEAREVIAAGKLAIVLGIEVPNLFSCYLTPRDGSPNCDAAYIEEQLDSYYARGVRALFPNHKFDNAFTPGDGHRGIVELGNFLQTAHWSNFVDDCPDANNVFDKGPVRFGGLNQPRDEYLAPAPNDLIQLSSEPLRDLLPYFQYIRAPQLPGNWCQQAGLTTAGAALVQGIMSRGMILEIDHLPQRSYNDVFGMLETANYPAVGTHGNTNGGRLYQLGGLSKTGFRRCADPADPGSMAASFRDHRDLIAAAGGYPGEGFGFDLNGLAGVPRPRFGPQANCAVQQEDPVEYPFDSFAGDVTFTAPTMGDRQVDFNNEGMIHIGLVPELIEDARRTGVSDEDLEFVFRSAEAYIRVWERAEERSEALRGD